MNFLSFFATTAYADTSVNYTPLAQGLPSILQISSVGPESLGNYIQGWFMIGIGAATVLAVIMITVAGIQYMSTDAYSKKEEGKRKLKNAVLGLLLIGASWLILYTINPDLIKINLNSLECEEGSTTCHIDINQETQQDQEQNATPENSSEHTLESGVIARKACFYYSNTGSLDDLRPACTMVGTTTESNMEICTERLESWKDTLRKRNELNGKIIQGCQVGTVVD